MANCGCSNDIWITAAFRSARDKEYYYFMKKEYVLYHWSLFNEEQKILRGPTNFLDDFPALKCSFFDDVGVTAAFPSHNAGKAFIFASKQVAEIDYAPYGGCTKVVKAPMPIVEMFPFLRCTPFDDGIDAAFETDNPCEVYIFKGNQCARINYAANCPKVIEKGLIKEFFQCLQGTIFEDGIEAANCLHQVKNQSFIFKGDTFARLIFNPGCSKSELCTPWKIEKPNGGLPPLGKLLPRKRTLNANVN